MNDKIIHLLADGLSRSRVDLDIQRRTFSHAQALVANSPAVIAALEAEVAEFENLLGLDLDRAEALLRNEPLPPR